LEVQYTVFNGTMNVSVWVPVSIGAQTGNYINSDCKVNPKNPKAPVCVNGTRKLGYDIATTHTDLGGKHANHTFIAELLAWSSLWLTQDVGLEECFSDSRCG
jgi:hypothetical protein